MAVPFEFLRGVLGVLCLLFAYMTGRTAAALRKKQQKPSRLIAWSLRTLACAVVVVVRHPIDALVIAVWLLSGVAFAIGWWDVSRIKKTEDLARQIFPE